MATNVNENSQQISSDFHCEKCNYNTVRKSDYNKHILTSKHKLATTRTKKSHAPNASAYICDNCNKQYHDRTGLWKHNKKCLINDSKDEVIMTLIKQNAEQSKQAAEKADEQMRQNAELHEKIIELCKNGVVNNTINNNNSNNKSFNLNFFLNETCKDAMNLTDFAKSVVLHVSDLITIGEAGYVNGMTNIIASHLNSLAENKRPIHCTDVKREVMYVKDENKWEKDVNKERMRLLIKKMDRKLSPLMAIYSNNYNKVYRSDTESIKHSQLRFEVYGGKHEESVNEDIIIRNISKIKALCPSKE
jgi:ribosomal protein L37AE/L43A